MNNPEYSGSIGEKGLTLYKVNSSTLTFIVPEGVPSGNHNLRFNIAGTNYSTTLNILENIQVSDPVSEFDQIYQELTSDTLLTGIDANAMSQALSELNGLTEAEQQIAIQFILNNKAALDQLANQIRQAELQTGYKFKAESEKMNIVVASVAVIVGAALSSSALVIAGSAYIIAKAIKAGWNFIKPYAGKLFDKVAKGLETAFNFVEDGYMAATYDAIMDEADNRLELKSTTALPDTIHLGDGEEFKFSILLVREPYVSEENAEEIPAIGELLDNYEKLKKALKEELSLPDPLTEAIKEYAEDLDGYAITTSNSNVDVSAITGTPELGIVTFSTEEEQDQPFQFTISYTNTENVTTSFTAQAKLEVFDPCNNPCNGLTSIVWGNHTYDLVEIGCQCWFAENLRYSNGIQQIADSAAWYDSGNVPKWAYYNYNPANTASYGKLYSWVAVNTGNLCPVGWHIPTGAEWGQLVTHLGGRYDAAEKMRATTWSGGTNESGFSALPGGYIFSNGANFDENTYGAQGHWWASDLSIVSNSFPYYFQMTDSEIKHTYGGTEYGKLQTDGRSCRCLKD